jgi:hypothetical protein
METSASCCDRSDKIKALFLGGMVPCYAHCSNGNNGIEKGGQKVLLMLYCLCYNDESTADRCIHACMPVDVVDFIF